MYRELRWLVRSCYRQRRICGRDNFLRLVIRGPQGKVMLSFHRRPPRQAREQLRLYNFRWSRKYSYWHAWLNNGRLEQVKKFCRLIRNDRL